MGSFRPYLGIIVVAGAALGTLWRVFIGTAWLLPVFGSAAVAFLLLALFRRLRFPLVIRIGLGFLIGVLAFGYLLVPDSIPNRSFIPDPGTVARFAGDAWKRSLGIYAPVIPEQGFLLLACMATWVGVLISEPLALSGRPILAAAPWVGLFAYTSVTGTRAGQTLAVALVSGAFIWMLGETRRPRARAQGGWVLGSASVAAALLLPGIVPGFQSPALLNFNSGPASRVEVSPMTQIRPRLSQAPETPLFEVQAAAVPAGTPLYWRLLALDEYSGETWHSSADYQRSRGKLPSVEPFKGSTVHVRQSYHIERLAGPWLPAAYQATNVSDVDIQVDPRGSALVTPGEMAADLSYQITSKVPTPTASQLIAAKPPSGMDEYRALSEISPEVLNLALSLTRAEPSQYKKVLAITEHLRRFRYDERVKPGLSGSELRRFLFETRAGYCEQFSGAMAVLVRAVGYPARVAVGFLPGDYDPGSETFVVTTKHAHAWTEVFFEGVGWVPFEPTPRDIASPPSYSITEAPAPLPETAPPEDPIVAEEQPVEQPALTEATPQAPAPSEAVQPRASRRLLTIAAVLVGILSLSVALVLFKNSRRRSARRRATAPRDLVIAAFRQVEAGAIDLARPRGVTETPSEYAGAISEAFGLEGDEVVHLLRAYERAMFAAQGPDDQQAELAWLAALRLRSQMWSGAGVRGKAALLASPRSLISSPRS